MGTSVKIMLSYDYCHFEICKSTTAAVTDEQVNIIRKGVQRLADEAVRQFIKAKAFADKLLQTKGEHNREQFFTDKILAKPEGERTVNEVAQLKAFEDRNWKEELSRSYNYDDDDEEPDFDAEYDPWDMEDDDNE